MLDVDPFKHYNDNYGHLADDGCLKALAQTLSQAARRAGDLAVRYGGEEFALLLPNTKAQKAMEIARILHQEVCLLAVPHAETSPGIVTVSLGVACIIPSREHIPEDLVRQADLALYHAKLSGRNCVQLATN
jgi:diguanylate cyclase (GGDEF)-like protein